MPRLKRELFSYIGMFGEEGVSSVSVRKYFSRVSRGNLQNALNKLREEGKIEQFVDFSLRNIAFRIKNNKEQ